MDSVYCKNFGQAISDCVFEEAGSRVFIVGITPDELKKTQQSDAQVEYFDSLGEAESRVAGVGRDEPSTLVVDLSLLSQSVEECLGRAIRSFPHRVIIYCTSPPDDTQSSDNTFFAFGFHKVLRHLPAVNSDQQIRWFEYRMSDYKPAPDWLNSRFWANPERFPIQEDPDLYVDEEE